MENQKHGGMFGIGEPNTAFAQYFIGNSYLKPLTKPGASVVSIANVTFEQDVEIIGIYIMLQKVEDKYLYVLKEKAGTKKKESLLKA